MLLANYGSDSDSEDENQAGPSNPSKIALPPPPRSLTSQGTNGSNGANPVNSANKNVGSGKNVKRKGGPVKITLDLPKTERKKKGGEDGEGEDGSDRDVEEEEEDREVKKPKINIKGKGSSALLGMLPPPKRKLPTNTTKSSGLAVNKSMATPKLSGGIPELGGLSAAEIAASANGAGRGDDDEDEEDKGMMLPPSIARGKAKTKAGPAVDLFGLSPTPSSSTSKPKPLLPPSISSAPSAPDYVPPEPTPQDPYPGYYQTPSGEWKAYDPEYYANFFKQETGVQLQGEEHEDDGRVGRHWEEYDTKGADLVNVDVGESLKRARAEEERKNLMKKPKMPGDEFEYQAIGQTKGLAAQRHQLTSLLQTAYNSREELEERIAQNKKNMRLAGQKYGF